MLMCSSRGRVDKDNSVMSMLLLLLEGDDGGCLEGDLREWDGGGILLMM